MEDRYSHSKKSSGAPWRSSRDGDFEEEDVGEALRESKGSTSNIAVTRHLPSAARMIPRSLSAISHVGSCCSTSTTHDDVKQQSAPVSIPDWSKVSTKMRNGSWHDDDDEEYKTKLPPHEIIARRLARSQIPSFSVLEGVGRKLKGRDLRKMRNAVLTKTDKSSAKVDDKDEYYKQHHKNFQSEKSKGGKGAYGGANVPHHPNKKNAAPPLLNPPCLLLTVGLHVIFTLILSFPALFLNIF